MRRPWRYFTHRYPGKVYFVRVWRWDPLVGQYGRPVLGYVGKTRRPLLSTRLAEHAATQPWWDLRYDDGVLYNGTTSDFGLACREVWHILMGMPLYNYQWNRLNPRRVPIYRAREEAVQRGRRGFLPTTWYERGHR